MSATTSDRFTVTKKKFTKRQKVRGEVKAYDYEVWLVAGWLKGKRVRSQFPSQSEALAERDRLEVEAADTAIGSTNPGAGARLRACELF